MASLMVNLKFEKINALMEVEKIFQILETFLEKNNFYVEKVALNQKVSIFRNSNHRFYDPENKSANLVLTTEYLNDFLYFCKGINVENDNDSKIKDLEIPKILFN